MNAINYGLTISSISYVLKTNIRSFIPIIILNQSSQFEEKFELMLLSDNSLIFLPSDFSQIKREINFSDIISITFDINEENLIQIKSKEISTNNIMKQLLLINGGYSSDFLIKFKILFQNHSLTETNKNRIDKSNIFSKVDFKHKHPDLDIKKYVIKLNKNRISLRKYIFLWDKDQNSSNKIKEINFNNASNYKIEETNMYLYCLPKFLVKKSKEMYISEELDFLSIFSINLEEKNLIKKIKNFNLTELVKEKISSCSSLYEFKNIIKKEIFNDQDNYNITEIGDKNLTIKDSNPIDTKKSKVSMKNLRNGVILDLRYITKALEKVILNSKVIMIKIEENSTIPLEKNLGKDSLNIEFHALEVATNYARNVLRYSKFYVLSSTQMKKSINFDETKWEIWEIKVKGIINNKETNEENAKYFSDEDYVSQIQYYNLSVIVVRCKNLLPFNETFQDINFYLSETYNPKSDSYDFSEKAQDTIIKFIDSIAQKYSPINNHLFKNISNQLKSIGCIYHICDSLTTTNINFLLEYDKIILKYCIHMTSKLIYILEDYMKENYIGIKNCLSNNIKNIFINAFQDINFNMNDYEEKIKSTNFSKLEKEYDADIKSCFDKYPEDFIANLMKKRNLLLYWCFNGGLTNNLININTIFKYFSNLKDLDKYDFVMIKLINHSQFNCNSDLSNDTYSIAVNKNILLELNKDKLSHFNVEFIHSLISSGYFAKLFRLNISEMNEFLVSLIYNKTELKSLEAITSFLSKFKIPLNFNETDDIQINNCKNKQINNFLFYDVAIELIRLYKNIQTNTFYLIVITTCIITLIDLNSEYDKIVKNKFDSLCSSILKEGIIENITIYLDSYNPILIDKTLDLLSKILNDKKTIKEIKNESLKKIFLVLKSNISFKTIDFKLDTLTIIKNLECIKLLINNGSIEIVKDILFDLDFIHKLNLLIVNSCNQDFSEIDFLTISSCLDILTYIKSKKILKIFLNSGLIRVIERIISNNLNEESFFWEFIKSNHNMSNIKQKFHVELLNNQINFMRSVLKIMNEMMELIKEDVAELLAEGNEFLKQMYLIIENNKNKNLVSLVPLALSLLNKYEKL